VDDPLPGETGNLECKFKPFWEINSAVNLEAINPTQPVLCEELKYFVGQEEDNKSCFSGSIE